MQIESIRALGKIGSNGAVRPLVDLLKKKVRVPGIKREIIEELGIDIKIIRQLKTFSFSRYYEKPFKMIPIICKPLSMTIKLSEHSQIIWSDPKNVLNHKLLPADIEIMEYFLSLYPD